MIDPQNTVYGIVTDNRAIMGTAKYTGEQFKFYLGYEFIRQNNPTTRWALAPLTRAVIS